MSPQIIAILKSYARGVVSACIPLIALNQTSPKAYLTAVLAGVVAPALRALDKTDPAFGLIADVIEEKTTKKAA
jgi:hypothetical protein